MEEQCGPREVDAGSSRRAIGLGPADRGVHALARVAEPDQDRADAGPLERCRDAVGRRISATRRR